LGPSCAALHRLQPDRADQLACGAEAALDETGAEQRLHHVAEDIVAVGPAVAARLLAEADMRRQADVARDAGAHLAADQRIEPLRKLALGRHLALVEPVGNGEAQHPVAEEFEALEIAFGPGLAMGERLQPERLALELADPRPPPKARGFNPHPAGAQ